MGQSIVAKTQVTLAEEEKRKKEKIEASLEAPTTFGAPRDLSKTAASLIVK